MAISLRQLYIQLCYYIDKTSTVATIFPSPGVLASGSTGKDLPSAQSQIASLPPPPESGPAGLKGSGLLPFSGKTGDLSTTPPVQPMSETIPSGETGKIYTCLCVHVGYNPPFVCSGIRGPKKNTTYMYLYTGTYLN